jgi:hypothetical protein
MACRESYATTCGTYTESFAFCIVPGNQTSLNYLASYDGGGTDASQAVPSSGGRREELRLFLFVECAHVGTRGSVMVSVSSVKSHKYRRKKSHKQQLDLANQYGATLMQAVAGALEHHRSRPQTDKPVERRRRGKHSGQR